MNYLKRELTCESIALFKIGESLGMKHNYVCSLIAKNKVYGEDGCGYYGLETESLDSVCEDMQKIFKVLLEESNGEYIKILND